MNAHPWNQDHMKSANVKGKSFTLVPRHLYESRPEDADIYETLLARLERDNVVRSKLA